MTKTLGIDLSHWQGSVNWQTALNAGAKFAVIRAGSITSNTGEVYTDYRWNENIANAPPVYREYYNSLGCPALASYWYFRPNWSRAAQAYHWHTLINPHPLKKHYLDVEETGGLSPTLLADRIKNMLDVMQDTMGMAFGIYTRASFWNTYVQQRSYWSDYDLWIARYDKLTHPWGDGKYVPRDWLDWSLWQWSADGNYRGSEFGASSPHIDLNYFNGDEAALKEYFDIVEIVPEPAPIPPPPDIDVNLPEKGKSMKLIPDYLDEPFVLQGFKSATGRGTQTITLSNLPKGAKGVICRLAVRGGDMRNWVALGGVNSGNARFRLDGRVHDIESFDIATGMIPLKDNRLYVNYDGHSSEVVYYIEIHGYGFEPGAVALEPIVERIDNLEKGVDLLDQHLSAVEKRVDIADKEIAHLHGEMVQRVKNVKIVVEK
jgi:GH25 family lysozyme M1 (1,4-beta-N-acetylmuramidase)